MNDAKAVPAATAISNYQARQMVKLMEAFYSDPKNRAAYNAWKAGKAQ